MTTRQVEIDWPAEGSGGQTVVHDTMQRDEVVAYHFQTPLKLGPKKGSIGLVEYGGQPSARKGCLSLTAFALDQPIAGEGTAFAGDLGPTVGFYGKEPSGDGKKGKNKTAVLKPSTDYYFNVTLDNPPAEGTFGSQVTFQKPKS